MTADAKTDEATLDEATTDESTVDVATGEEPESTASQEASPETVPAKGVRNVLPALRRRLGTVLLTLALLASAGVATWLYFSVYRPDQQTDGQAQKVVVDAATTGTIALLSYAPDTLDKDFTAAKSHLTGNFLNYYTEFTQKIVTPAAKQKQVKTSAQIGQAAVAEMHPDSAVVLVFVNQTTVSKENPDGAFASSAVKVGMTKVDGHWLISAFDPV